jgi:amino acid adenylation domain-containing protein
VTTLRRLGQSVAPLSAAQQAIWVADRLSEESALYNQSEAVRLHGRFDTSALRCAFGGLVRRHEILRTSFVVHDGIPRQTVHVASASDAFPLNVVDVSRMPRGATDAFVRSQVAIQAGRSIDLSAATPLRATLWKIADDEHVLLRTIHHIAFDGWSAGILRRELSTLYAAYAEGADDSVADGALPRLPVQYGDYALWEAERLHAGEFDGQLTRWQSDLVDAPWDFSLGAEGTTAPTVGKVAEHRFSIPIETSRALNTLARCHGATLYMALLAAFEVLIARCSGRTDFLIGTPAANRTRCELEGLIGLFVNTQVLRSDVRWDAASSDVLTAIRARVYDAVEHLDVPFEKAVERLPASLLPDRTALSRVIFQMRQSPVRLDLPGVGITPIATPPTAAMWRLALSVSDSDSSDGRPAVIEYREALFEESNVAWLARAFVALLSRMVNAPDQRVRDLDLLTAVDRRVVVDEWSRTGRDDWWRSVHELIAERARETPDSIAVEFAHDALTYRDLLSRASGLAVRLAAAGVAVDQPVAVHVRRGPDLVVAAVAVLMAGGAYLPVDTSYPPARAERMVSVADAAAIIADDPSSVDWARRRPVIPIAAGSDDIPPPAGRSDEPPSIRPANAAYVIFTSGSTGEPKGVIATHSGLSNLVRAQTTAFRVDRASRVLQFASSGFDAAISELFVTLCAGATLVIAPDGARESSSELIELIDRSWITHVTLPPPVGAMLRGGHRYPSFHLQTVVFAGERLPLSVAESWRPSADRIVNAYGPAEITVCATTSEVRSGDTRPAIGPPIPNASAYVLDAWMQPVPPGIEGELYFGGAGVARGYAGRPALTAERFVPDPFAATPPRRLYRTGDRAVWRADGTLEFRGRVDSQIKIRGCRIEPDEVRHALMRHPTIRDCFVMPRENVTLGPQLVAYVVGSGAEDLPATRELREFLGAYLPRPMIPDCVVAMRSLPLNASGKVDVARLPSIAASEDDATDLRPASDLETAVASIYSELLGKACVGIHDNFFELGGHSLLAMQLVSRIRRSFQVDVRLADVLHNPTVAECAETVGRAIRVGPAQTIPRAPRRNETVGPRA